MGPIVLGTALNPYNDNQRKPLTEDEIDDDLDINGRNNTALQEFTIYQPDEEFNMDKSTNEN